MNCEVAEPLAIVIRLERKPVTPHISLTKIRAQ
jgi:hypothetical protein